jgi:hypothetical protein
MEDRRRRRSCSNTGYCSTSVAALATTSTRSAGSDVASIFAASRTAGRRPMALACGWKRRDERGRWVERRESSALPRPSNARNALQLRA